MIETCTLVVREILEWQIQTTGPVPTLSFEAFNFSTSLALAALQVISFAHFGAQSCRHLLKTDTEESFMATVSSRA